jgi:L-aspartate oxidase
MYRYNPQAELACRDVVARAIENELAMGHGHNVFLDCTHLQSDDLVKHFPNVYNRCLNVGIDITKDLIPITPAAHFVCGGIAVDRSAETSVTRLYALGECSYTGLHGANRLASNSLLEAVVFAEFCFQDIKRKSEWPHDLPDDKAVSNPYVITNNALGLLPSFLEAVQNLMTGYSGITRTTKRLRYAADYLRQMNEVLQQFYGSTVSTDLMTLRNIVQVSQLIVEQSLARDVNRGTFYNRDLDLDCV